jgi:hypothetical protein
MNGAEQQVAGGEMGRWRSAAAARLLSNGPCLVRTILFFHLFKDFSNPFELKMVKDSILLLKNFQTKYGHVEN